ncbi:hypothetical protein Q5N24_021370, partial [Xanthomonas vasicola]|uniref:hypothetical protein n=1 Tax=Xanthomonas vasicola TaxID=56459 RepID=UPI0038AC60FE
VEAQGSHDAHRLFEIVVWLCRIWPQCVATAVAPRVVHHVAFVVEVRRRFSSGSTQHAVTWLFVSRIRKAP